MTCDKRKPKMVINDKFRPKPSSETTFSLPYTSLEYRSAIMGFSFKILLVFSFFFLVLIKRIKLFSVLKIRKLFPSSRSQFLLQK